MGEARVDIPSRSNDRSIIIDKAIVNLLIIGQRMMYVYPSILITSSDTTNRKPPKSVALKRLNPRRALGLK